MLLDFVCWLEWLKRKTSFSSTERMCHTFWAKAVRDETATPEQKGRGDLLQGQQASWLMGAGGGGCFWIVIFSVKSEARSELSLSRGIEVGGRRSGCEGSSRGGRRTHCRGLGGGRGGGTGGSRDQAEQLPSGATALTPGLKHTCPTSDSGVSCPPPPFLAGVRGPFPGPAHLESSGVPPQGAATAEFHTSGRECHPPSPKRSSQAKPLLPLAGDGFAARPHHPPSCDPAPGRWKGPCPLSPLAHFNSFPALPPALLRRN